MATVVNTFFRRIAAQYPFCFNISKRYSYSTDVTNIKCIYELNPSHKKLKVQGWIKSIRSHKEVTFIAVDDGSTLKRLQVIAKPSLLNNLTVGCAVSIEGEIVPSSHPQQPVELLAENIDILGTCDETFPFRIAKKCSSENSRQHLHLRSRTKAFSALLNIRNAVNFSLHKYHQANGYCFIHTPILTSNDCEGAGDVFEVAPAKSSKTSPNQMPISAGNKRNFFDTTVYLTVSGQLHLEAIVCGGKRKVYGLGPTFRAENSRTRRHLSEFYMLESEIAFINSLEDIMKIIEDMLKWCTKDVLSNCSEELQSMNQEVPSGYQNRLQQLLEKDFARISYTEAINILANNCHKLETSIHWGFDLQKEHEDFIVHHCGGVPVFITDYPSSLKPFYMKSNGDERDTVAALDLLVPVVGELCGGSLREERLPIIDHKLKQLSLQDNLKWYLDLRRYGTIPHGGFGMGLERYIRFISGIPNIKDTIPFPRWPHNCAM